MLLLCLSTTRGAQLQQHEQRNTAYHWTCRSLLGSDVGDTPLMHVLLLLLQLQEAIDNHPPIPDHTAETQQLQEQLHSLNEQVGQKLCLAKQLT
jgi:hypothetical protein